ELRTAQQARARGRGTALPVSETSSSRQAAQSPRPPATPESATAGGDLAGAAELASPTFGTAPIGPDTFGTDTGSQASHELGIQSGSVYRDPETGEEIRVDEVVDLDLRQVYVTASGFGQREPGLEKHELTLLDNGREQTIVTLEQGDIPFTATLLLDASGSMEGERLGRALAGARAFVDGMGPFDRARLLVAADRIRELSPLVAAGDEAAASLGQRLAGTTAAGGTALYDHLFLALDTLEPEQGRKVVIVLSDGYDLMSAVAAETIQGVVQRGQIQLYWIRLVQHIDPRLEKLEHIPSSPWRTKRQHKAQLRLFEETVKKSGGRIVAIDRDSEVAEALADILAELRDQIAIGYYAEPRHGDGRWRGLALETSRRGVKLRHVSGYIDD
ncbi:MAG: VWA domain-containing protein, partial [Holophagales bacterium]|nr:VWA domain-containing protein [Holophagales bacterium]